MNSALTTKTLLRPLNAYRSPYRSLRKTETTLPQGLGYTQLRIYKVLMSLGNTETERQ